MGKHNVKPRKPRQYRTTDEYELTPHENLALAIVTQAVNDARTLMDGGRVRNGGVVSKWELLNFFRGQWCGVLLGTSDLDGDYIAERIGLYDFCCR